MMLVMQAADQYFGKENVLCWVYHVDIIISKLFWKRLTATYCNSFEFIFVV